jgi:hypothetical protein
MCGTCIGALYRVRRLVHALWMRIVGQENARRVGGRTTVTVLWFLNDLLVCAKRMVRFTFIPGDPELSHVSPRFLGARGAYRKACCLL